MKNLLIYINPKHDFGYEEKTTVKIQIDNSLSLGWKPEDILLITNFPYEYNGIKSIIVGDENYCDFHPQLSKINTLVNLFESGFFKPDILYFYHDLDVFQNEVITQSELESELGSADLGATDKGRMPMWNTGTLVFKSSAADIFCWLKDILFKFRVDEEHALWILCGNDFYLDESQTEFIKGYTNQDIPALKDINQRVKKINITYNFRMWNLKSTFPMAKKPIKAIHFHPLTYMLYNPSINEIDFFMYGKNKINTILMPERLIEIFQKHGVK